MTDMREKIARLVLDGMREKTQPPMEGGMQTADAIIAALPDMVKPLEWVREKADRGTWYSDIYTIRRLWDDQYVVRGWSFGSNPYETLEAAKYAAQADYTRRIMSAFGL